MEFSLSGLCLQVHQELVTSLNKSVSEEYGVSTNNDTRDAIDDLQSTFRCCGAESFEDWRHSQWWRSELKLSNKVEGYHYHL